MMHTIRRALALFKARSLEIELQGQNDAMQSVSCPETRIAISLARQQTRRALVAARASYLALLPSGNRRTWEVA